MLPFVLYLLAGGLTAVQVYSLMALGASGGVVSPLEFLSLLGSAGLVGSAYLSLWKPRLAARVALIAALLVWSFYAPATLHFLQTRQAQTAPHAGKGAR